MDGLTEERQDGACNQEISSADFMTIYCKKMCGDVQLRTGH